jgi:histidinol-phosphate phosphatase family protein
MKKNQRKQPAVFVDRDGTLIEEVNYLSRVGDLSLFPFTAEAVGLLKSNGFLVIVVTNQSGIGRDIFSESDMHAIHLQIQNELSAAIDGFYFCPHLPCDGCACRKPGIGMIESAMNDFDIDIEASWIVGDKNIDIELARTVGLRSALVLTGYGRTHQEILNHTPDIIAPDLHRAVKQIINASS